MHAQKVFVFWHAQAYNKCCSSCLPSSLPPPRSRPCPPAQVWKHVAVKGRPSAALQRGTTRISGARIRAGSAHGRVSLLSVLSIYHEVIYHIRTTSKSILLVYPSLDHQPSVFTASRIGALLTAKISKDYCLGFLEDGTAEAGKWPLSATGCRWRMRKCRAFVYDTKHAIQSGSAQRPE